MSSSVATRQNSCEHGSALAAHRLYDEDGNETERVVLDAAGDLRMLNVEKNRGHSLECLESGSVLFECKDGAYHPLEEGEVMVK